MTIAAEKAGLLKAGNLSAQEKESVLLKLMEEGKLVSSKVLPELGTAFKTMSNYNGMLKKSLRDGLQVPMVNAKNSLDLFVGSIYKGMQPTLKLMFEGSTRLTDAFQRFGKVLGETAGWAVYSFTSAFRLLGAAIYDVGQALGFISSSAGDFGDAFEKFTPKIIGAVAAMWALLKIAKVVKGTFGLMKFGGALTAAAGSVTKGAAKEGLVISLLRQIAVNTGLSAGVEGGEGAGWGKKGKVFNLLKHAAALTTVGYGISMIPDFSPVNLRRKSELESSGMPENFPVSAGFLDVYDEWKGNKWKSIPDSNMYGFSSIPHNTPWGEVKITIDTKGAEDLIKTEVTKSQSNMLSETQQQISTR
jgi:hypothetical protein